MKNTLNDSSATLDPLLSDHEAAAYLGVSRATFWRRVSDSTIPRPVKIGHASRWPASDIVSVVDAAKTKRDMCQ